MDAISTVLDPRLRGDDFVFAMLPRFLQYLFRSGSIGLIGSGMHRIALKQLLAVVLMALWSAASAAGEAGLRILPPAGCVPADGGPAVQVHAVVWGTGSGQGTLRLHTDRGRFERVEPLGDRLFRAMYVPPARKQPGTVTWAGEWTSGARRLRAVQELALCPHPVGTVRVKAEPARLLAGEGQQAALHIRVADPQGMPLSGQPLQITTNVGRIDLFRDLGDGSYRAVFLPPDDPYPQVAIIMVANPAAARLDRVAVGRVVIPITARIELPGKTAPRTRMEMVVAGRRFGPVRADRRGDFEIPILVPPGYGTGRATSIDRAGNRKTRRVELYLPETNQLGLWGYPRELAADGRARSRLLVTTIDRFGKPTDIGGVVITARAGEVGAVRDVGSGFYEAYYRAPSSTGEGRDELVVTFPRGGARSRAELGIRLLPGPAARAVLDAPARLPADGRTAGRLEVTVLDGRGNPVPGQRVEVEAAPGRVGDVAEPTTGRHRTSLVVGEHPPRWSSYVRAVVRDLPGKKPECILVAPASLVTDEAGNTLLEVALVDRTGRPVAGAPVTLCDKPADSMPSVTPVERQGSSGSGLPAISDGGSGNSERGSLRHQMAPGGGAGESTGKTNEYGRVRFVLVAGSDGRGGPRAVVLRADGGRVWRRIFWMPAPGEPRLLSLGLDPALPPDAPLSATAEVALYPPPPLEMVVTARAPEGPGRPWRVVARLEAGGKPVRGRAVAFETSTGNVGQAREVRPGTYQAEFTPGAPGWKRAVVTAIESRTRVGAVLTIEEESREGQPAPGPGSGRSP